MDEDVEGKIGPGHSSGQARRRQDIQDQSVMGRPETYCLQRRTAEMELVWSTLHVGSIRNVVRNKRISNCVGVYLYERTPAGWSAIMDDLAKVHDIAKDTKHPTNISRQQKKAREECKTHALDARMSESRFQVMCTTRYIMRRLLPFRHVECPEFRATVHPAWKVIKAKTQRNLVAEMYLCMVEVVKKAIAAVMATDLLPPFWINADL